VPKIIVALRRDMEIVHFVNQLITIKKCLNTKKTPKRIKKIKLF